MPVKPKRRSRAKKVAAVEAEAPAELAFADADEAPRKAAASNDQSAPADARENESPDGQSEAGDESGTRRGWWQRTFG